jgi:hypothetical protein
MFQVRLLVGSVYSASIQTPFPDKPPLADGEFSIPSGFHYRGDSEVELSLFSESKSLRDILYLRNNVFLKFSHLDFAAGTLQLLWRAEDHKTLFRVPVLDVKGDTGNVPEDVQLERKYQMFMAGDYSDASQQESQKEN